MLFRSDNKILRICFAVFLISVGVWQLVVAIKFIVKKKKSGNLPVIAQPMLPSENLITSSEYEKSEETKR